MSKRSASGTRFTDASEQRASRTRQVASLWKIAKAAVRLVDDAKVIQQGVYSLPPATMLSLKSLADDIRFALKMQELEIRKAEQEGESEDE